MADRETRRINAGPLTFRTNLDVAIHVDDLKRAEEFYGKVLGFRQVSGSAEHLEYDSGALRLYIRQNPRSAAFIPSLEVSDLVAARQRLEEAGCMLVPLPEGGFLMHDPFGVLIDLVERPPQ